MTMAGTDDPLETEQGLSRLVNRRSVLAGAAGLGALGIGATVAARSGGGGSTPTAISPTTSATPSSSATRTRTTATARPTTASTSAAASTTAASTTAPTTAPPTSAPTTSEPGETSTPPEQTSTPPPETSTPPPETSTPPPSSPPPPPPPPGEFLANTADVPVTGGLIFSDVPKKGDATVVTQPAGAQFKCFSGICTHLGCTVGSVKQNTIECPCHGSQFDAATGDVTNGPAKKPLPGRQIAVQDGKIYLI